MMKFLRKSIFMKTQTILLIFTIILYNINMFYVVLATSIAGIDHSNISNNNHNDKIHNVEIIEHHDDNPKNLHYTGGEWLMFYSRL